MWVLLAFASALFAGLTAILAKVGIKDVDSNLATALRTVVVVMFAWSMVFVVGSADTIRDISGKSLLFLVLSGLATGASWLCYFRALQMGEVNKVVPIDKSSTVLTMLLAFLLLGEKLTVLKAVAMAGITAGTYLMIERKASAGDQKKGISWLWYALCSAIFASLTSILGKIGIEGVESNLGTAIRTVVVLVMAWGIVLGTGKQRGVVHIGGRSWLFLVLSGFATGLSWLCYYRALQNGPASVVVPIDKLSILVSIAFSYFVFKEKINKRSGAGLGLVVAGTFCLLI